MQTIEIQVPLSSKNERFILDLDDREDASSIEMKVNDLLRRELNICLEQINFSLYLNSKNIRSLDAVQLDNFNFIRVHFHCLGGKGGFGSNLRTQAITKKKIINFDQSRDNQGRRIKNVQNEKKLIEFLKKEKEEKEMIDKEKQESKKILKEIKNAKFESKLDENYTKKIIDTENDIKYSVRDAILQQRSNQDRKEEEEQKIEHDSQDEIDDRLNNASLSIQHKDQQEESVQPLIEQKIKIDIMAQQEEGPVLKTVEKQSFDQLNLDEYQTIEDFNQIDPQHLQAELSRLGLQCGGTPIERAKRLFEIKENPNLMFNTKYLAQK